MKYLKFEILSILLVLNIACDNNKKNTTQERIYPKYLEGYWIPKDIKWGGDDSNSKDTGDIFRIAAFKTLCFRNDNGFLYFVSTQRRPHDYNDSIIFAGEPSFNTFGGTWKYVNDTSLQVDYKPIEYNINPPDTKERHEQIKVFFEDDTLLLFENKLYARTQKYDKISRQTIEEYKKHYLK